jgi:ATP-binding cassette subfamily F protein 3
MRHTLLMALQEFAGAVVVVSHDRALLRGVCDRFVLVAGGQVTEFDGDLEDYAAWLGAQRGGGGARPGAESPSRREQRRLEAEARARLSPLRGEQQRLEGRLKQLAGERVALEAQLADPSTYADAPRAEQERLARRHGELAAETARVEERWLEVMTALEQAS